MYFPGGCGTLAKSEIRVVPLVCAVVSVLSLPQIGEEAQPWPQGRGSISSCGTAHSGGRPRWRGPENLPTLRKASHLRQD